MPTTGSDIVSYSGNPLAGSGANAGIPVSTTKDLDVINQSSRDAMLSNLALNKHLFDQKIRDRDTLLQELDSGNIRVGDILEEDTPYVKEGLDKLDEAFFNRTKKGINDIDAAREYKKALREATMRTTQAQARKKFYDEESGEVAKEILPRKQQARKQNLDSNIKGGFWKDLTPYQQTHDLDIGGDILSTAANVTTEFTDPSTLTKGTRTIFDYDKTLAANTDNFLNDVNKRTSQQQLMQSLQALDPQKFKATIDAMNNRINEYNSIKGLNPGDEGFVTSVDAEFNPQTRQFEIKESLPDFSAKYTLAHQKPFASSASQFDTGRATFELGKQRNQIAEEANRIRAIQAAAAMKRANAYSRLQGLKANQLEDSEKRVKGFWDEIVGKVKSFGTEGGGKEDFVFLGDLPAGYQNIAGLDAKGQPIKLEPLTRGVGGRTKYYKPKYYTATDGQEIDKNFLNNKFSIYKDAGGKGSYDDYVRQLIKSGVVDLELIGKNGVANFNTALQTAQSLSNKSVTQKTDEPLFEETVTTQQEE